ncbi:hypothetical protein [Butyrivibrio sp. XB500-5]|uniref:hypothetical protein n=1 Tax=Butyrivibrio sp. XB500-5 TaxID=2364880 RepID=UPI001FA98D2E|nr:hypothetical protein [Butyrivibrio sp. XB500-5]
MDKQSDRKLSQITPEKFLFVDSLMAFTAFDVYGAKKVSLGVFENNESAYYCYKVAGFKDVILDEIETYEVLGEEWKCTEMAIER